MYILHLIHFNSHQTNFRILFKYKIFYRLNYCRLDNKFMKSGAMQHAKAIRLTTLRRQTTLNDHFDSVLILFDPFYSTWQKFITKNRRLRYTSPVSDYLSLKGSHVPSLQILHLSSIANWNSFRRAYPMSRYIDSCACTPSDFVDLVQTITTGFADVSWGVPSIIHAHWVGKLLFICGSYVYLLLSSQR